MANSCPACGKKYSLPTGAIGRAFVCKRCGLKLEITDDGLSIPSVPDTGPPIPTPQPIDRAPPPKVEPIGSGRPAVETFAVKNGDSPRPAAPIPVRTAAPVAAQVAAPQQPAAYPPPGYYPYPPAPAYPAAPPQPAPPPPRVEFALPDDNDDDDPPPRRRPQSSSTLLDFLLLRRHIAPTLIVLFHWIGTFILVVSGLITIVGSFNTVKSVSIAGGGLDLGGLAGMGEAGQMPILGGGLPAVKEERGFSFPMFLLGLSQLVIGPILLRVICEFVIVVFRINETLHDVKDRLGRERR